jgi:hypothetical protein
MPNERTRTVLIHPGVTSSFAVAYVVLGVSAVFDLVSFRQSAGQMSGQARRYHRELLEETKVTSEPSLRAVFVEDAVSVFGRRDRVGRPGPQSDPRIVDTAGSGCGAHRAGDDPRQSSACPAQPRLALHCRYAHDFAATLEEAERGGRANGRRGARVSAIMRWPCRFAGWVHTIAGPGRRGRPRPGSGCRR